MGLLATVILYALKFYTFIIIASAVVSWLIAFDVLNTRNPQAQNLVDLLNRLTEPVYRPIRKYVPPIGGVDISPIIVIILIWILEQMVVRLLLF